MNYLYAAGCFGLAAFTYFFLVMMAGEDGHNDVAADVHGWSFGRRRVERIGAHAYAALFAALPAWLGVQILFG